MCRYFEMPHSPDNIHHAASVYQSFFKGVSVFINGELGPLTHYVNMVYPSIRCNWLWPIETDGFVNFINS